MDNNVLREITYGVYVVSTLNGDKPTGCVVNSVMQVTYDTIAVSVNHSNFTNECIKKSKKFAISILGENCDDNVIPVFGFQSGREADKFLNFRTQKVCGLEVLDDAVGYIVCDVDDILETETHTVFLGKMVDGGLLNKDKVMTYAYYHNVKKGKSPKAAPTYIEESLVADELSYRCSICGYVYKGDITKEAENFECPVCRQPKSVFVKQ